MDEVKLCECIIYKDAYFTIDDIVTVESSSGDICYGRVKTISRHTALGQIQYIVLDTSTNFNSDEIKIPISSIKNIYRHETKGEEK